jgi:hypothetical protein
MLQVGRCIRQCIGHDVQSDVKPLCGVLQHLFILHANLRELLDRAGRPPLASSFPQREGHTDERLPFRFRLRPQHGRGEPEYIELNGHGRRPRGCQEPSSAPAPRTARMFACVTSGHLDPPFGDRRLG